MRASGKKEQRQGAGVFRRTGTIEQHTQLNQAQK
jgi:hypothetical protein